MSSLPHHYCFIKCMLLRRAKQEHQRVRYLQVRHQRHRGFKPKAFQLGAKLLTTARAPSKLHPCKNNIYKEKQTRNTWLRVINKGLQARLAIFVFPADLNWAICASAGTIWISQSPTDRSAQLLMERLMSRLRDYNILSSLFPFRPDVPPSTSRAFALWTPISIYRSAVFSIWVYIYKMRVGNLSFSTPTPPRRRSRGRII